MFHNPKNCKTVADSNFRRPPAFPFSHADRFRAGDVPKPQGPDHQYLVKDKVPGPYWSFGKAGRPEQGTKGLATSNDLLRNDLSKTNLHNGGTCVFGTGLRNNVGITDPVVYLGICSPGPAGYMPPAVLNKRTCTMGVKTAVLGSASQTGPYIAPGKYPIHVDSFMPAQPVYSFSKAERVPKAAREMDALAPPKMPPGSMGKQVLSTKRTAMTAPLGVGTRDQQLKLAVCYEHVPAEIAAGHYSEELMGWNSKHPVIPELPLYKDSIKFGSQVSQT